MWGSGATVLWGRNGIPNALQDGIKMHRGRKVRKGDFSLDRVCRGCVGGGVWGSGATVL